LSPSSCLFYANKKSQISVCTPGFPN
jgi:hypothetical protein